MIVVFPGYLYLHLCFEPSLELLTLLKNLESLVHCFLRNIWRYCASLVIKVVAGVGERIALLASRTCLDKSNL